jgi:ABC-type uncharacterized transport system YnjBCD permease subunit
MRAYLIPLVAGVVLSASAFLPWVIVGNATWRGLSDAASLPTVPRFAGLWIVTVGALAAVLATLSLITRKNSRHPLFLIGLVALGLIALQWRMLPRTIGDLARVRNQAIAIVGNTPESALPVVSVGDGLYLGLLAASVLVGFGLTIVVKRASQPYVVPSTDDDV